MTPMLTLNGSQGPMLLHPRYVMRVAGEPAQLLDALDTGATAAALAEQQRLRTALAGQSAALVAKLERVVQGCDDRDLGRAALNLKRAVHNLRPAKPEQVAALSGLLDAATVAALAQFNADTQALAGMDARIRQAYADEMEATSARLPALWDAPRLQDAISYSNPELYADFEALAGRRGKTLAPKARRKLEDTFVQYLARCASKTSPLSTFTVLHNGRWEPGTGSDGLASWALDYGASLDRRVSLKGALMRQILAPLLGNYSLSASLFPLVMNPSTVFENGRARFRTVTAGNTASGKSWGTGDAVAEINVNAVVACLHHVYAQRSFEAIHEADLVTAMCKLAPKLNPVAVRELLGKLYDLRLLLPEIPQWEQIDPLVWTETLLAGLPGEPGTASRAHLQHIKQALQDFRSAPPARRAALVGTVRDEVQALRGALYATEPAGVAHPAFFENCYLHELQGSLRPQLLEPFADDLGLLLALSPLVSFTQQARCQMADFFLAQHGADGVCTTPLEFIKAFDGVYALGSMTHTPDPTRRAPETAISQAFSHARNAFNALITPLLQQPDDVQLDARALQALVDMLPEPVRQRGGSQSYVGQLATRGGRPLFVLNQVFGGRGALMSRFMEVLDTPALQEVRDYLVNSSEGALFAELPGVFGFNANQHPRMADHELVVPPFAANWEETQKFEIDKLRLVYDAREHMVRFRTEDGRDVDVWYQGFLMPMLLPRIQRVLALAYTEGINNFTIGPMMKRGLLGGDRVTYVPRVSLGDVVLARRTWIVPPALLPDAELASEDFFIALQAWRAQIGLPADVFVRAMPVPEGGGDPGAAMQFKWDEIDFKDLKPFHVKFASPRGVRLLQRMLKRNRFSIVCTEVLPALDDQHVAIEGRHHVAELQFELSTVPQRLAAPQTQDSWQAVRIAYFDDDRRGLLLGPVQALLDDLRQRHALDRVMLLPHWKHGPHLDVVVHCSDRALREQVLPLVQQHVGTWLQQHPSTTVLDPVAYAALSQKLALTELDPDTGAGTLLLNNSITRATYERPKTLKLAEFGRAREDFQVAALPLTLQLLQHKAGAGEAGDAFTLTLLAMLAMTGQTYELGGLSRGYVSFRSHAEYFFAAYDQGAQLRQRFDALDQRLAAQVDAVLRAVIAGDIDAVPLPDAHRSVLRQWAPVIAAAAEDNRRIVRLNYQVLLADETFARLQGEVTRVTPVDYQQHMRSKVPSEIGRALAQPQGMRAMNTPQIMAYRTSVNFFYTLLPLLAVSPMQKFCLCHLVASGVERVLGVSWRDITGLRAGGETTTDTTTAEIGA